MREKEHFLDKNTLTAVILIFLAWFGWDMYMRKKFPKTPAPIQEPLEKKYKTPTKTPTVESAEVKEPLLQKKEQLFLFNSPELSFTLSSKGMGFTNIALNQIKDKENKKVQIFNEDSSAFLPFETQFKGPLHFKIKKIGGGEWRGLARKKGLKFLKTLKVDSKLFLIDTKLQVSGRLEEGLTIKTFIVGRPPEQKSTGFLSLFVLPDFLSVFVSSAQGSKLKPLTVEDSAKILSEAPYRNVLSAGLGSKYFGQGFVDQSSTMADLSFKFFNGMWAGVLSHAVLNPDQDFELSYKLFAGPKSLNLLKQNYPKLISWVDFGWFGALARLILEILHFFHKFLGNWGWSVVLLTILVRVLLLPFVLSSHRSMAVMKKIQPELNKLREKFKKDPQRMNQEVMALMKAHKANPLGGCLPMLLQIPVFWALWKALGSSYSLYQSPFIFWVRDLSSKDPYYILPVLIGFLMFIQQKLTPAAGNKEIMRAMQILPIFMVFFMLNLPSGLTLYVLISSLFGLLQQLYLNVQTPVPASAGFLKKETINNKG